MKAKRHAAGDARWSVYSGSFVLASSRNQSEGKWRYRCQLIEIARRIDFPELKEVA